jgi:hypothetical protein
MKKIPLVGTLLFLIACSSTKQTIKSNLKDDNTFELNEIAKDATYGLSEKNPIEVGGVSTNEGPKNERRFLNALAGPNGEKISYFRASSCCPIKSNSNPMGTGRVMLDNYRVTWEDSNDTISIYINMYDSGILKAPKGFTIKK